MTPSVQIDERPLDGMPEEGTERLLLPTITHLSSALNHADMAKGHLDIFALIVNGAPRESAAVLDSLRAASLHIRDAATAYEAALAVATCEGQA